MSWKQKTGDEGCWTKDVVLGRGRVMGVGGVGPTAVRLIASPHKRAFKALPLPAAHFAQIRVPPSRCGSARGQEDAQRGQR